MVTHMYMAYSHTTVQWPDEAAFLAHFTQLGETVWHKQLLEWCNLHVASPA